MRSSCCKICYGHQASYFISLMKINKGIVEQKKYDWKQSPKDLTQIALHTHMHGYICIYECVFI